MKTAATSRARCPPAFSVGSSCWSLPPRKQLERRGRRETRGKQTEKPNKDDEDGSARQCSPVLAFSVVKAVLLVRAARKSLTQRDQRTQRTTKQDRQQQRNGGWQKTPSSPLLLLRSCGKAVSLPITLEERNHRGHREHGGNKTKQTAQRNAGWQQTPKQLLCVLCSPRKGVSLRITLGRA